MPDPIARSTAVRPARLAARGMVVAALVGTSTVGLGTSPAVAVTGQHLKNGNSGQCLVVRGTANETIAVQSYCGNYDDQRWVFPVVDQAAHTFRIQNVQSGKCLVNRGNASGTPVRQVSCGRYPDQVWESDGPHTRLRNRNNGRCIVVKGYPQNAQATVAACGNYFDQYWTPYI